MSSYGIKKICISVKYLQKQINKFTYSELQILHTFALCFYPSFNTMFVSVL